MSQTIQEKNKALVLEAFDTLFNKRDYVAAERYWSPNYIQHSAHIEPGRDGLFNLIKSIPPTLKYEPGTIMAENESSAGAEGGSGFRNCGARNSAARRGTGEDPRPGLRNLSQRCGHQGRPFPGHFVPARPRARSGRRD